MDLGLAPELDPGGRGPFPGERAHSTMSFASIRDSSARRTETRVPRESHVPYTSEVGASRAIGTACPAA